MNKFASLVALTLIGCGPVATVEVNNEIPVFVYVDVPQGAVQVTNNAVVPQGAIEQTVAFGVPTAPSAEGYVPVGQLPSGTAPDAGVDTTTTASVPVEPAPITVIVSRTDAVHAASDVSVVAGSENVNLRTFGFATYGGLALLTRFSVVTYANTDAPILGECRLHAWPETDKCVSAAVADGGVVTFDLTGDDCVVGPEADGQGILLDVDCDVLDEAAPGTILDLHAWAMSGENADEATVLGSSAAVAFGYDESLAVHKTIVTSASPMPTIDMSDVHGELHEGHQVIAQFTVTAGSVDIVARRFAYGYRAQHYDPYGGDNSYGYGVGQASFSVSTDVSPGGSTIGIPGIESVWAGSTAPAAEPPYYNAPGMQTVWTAFETPRTIRAGRSETFEIVVNVVGPLTYGDQLLVTALRLDYASDDGYLQVSSQMTFVAPLGG